MIVHITANVRAQLLEALLAAAEHRNSEDDCPDADYGDAGTAQIDGAIASIVIDDRISSAFEAVQKADASEL